MNIHTAYRALSSAELVRPKCPRCGATILMAERASFNPDGRIRHAWSCDDCGQEFTTSIRALGAPAHA
jgi:ribosomal protein S27AE